MNQETQNVRKATGDLIDSMQKDVLPFSSTQLAFGIKNRVHYMALKHAYFCDGVDEEHFDAACGKGAEIQNLISETKPYRDAKFVTAWDKLIPLRTWTRFFSAISPGHSLRCPKESGLRS